MVLALTVVSLSMLAGACGGGQEDRTAKTTPGDPNAAETGGTGGFSQPSAATVAFLSNRDGNAEIYTMSAEGSEPANLTRDPAIDASPAFSTDGRTVAFQSDREGNFDIYVSRADGSGQKRITFDPADDSAPAFSPDGEKMAFVSGRDGDAEVYAMGTDGSDPTNLSRSPASDVAPTFSSDGKKLVFVSDRDGNAEIYTMNVDGTGQTRITRDPAYDSEPVFLPESSGVAFTSDRDGDAEIYAADYDGSNQTRLTDNSANDGQLCPLDGGRMAFASDRDGDAEILTMNADGSRKERLTDNATHEFYPAFSPGRRAEESVVAEAAPEPPRDAASRTVLELSNPILATDDLPYYPVDHHRSFTFAPGGDKVSFVIDSGANQGIYEVNSDGTGLTSLDGTAATEGQPTFPPQEPIYSSNGASIMFARTIPRSNPDGVYKHQADLYVAKSGGADPAKATYTDSANESSPVFSPDGARVAYVRSTQDNGQEIYAVDVGGRNQNALTESLGNDLQPVFSRNGEKVAFASNRDGMGNFEVYAMNADGSNQTRLTNNAAWDDHPTFSPDGKRVAFSRRDPMSPEDVDVFAVNVDGTDLTRLTHHPGYDGQPVFVPGTDMVAFVSGRDGDDDIYAVGFDGAGLTPLTNTDSASEAAPAFSADGTKMAYASARRDGSDALVYEVYVADLNQGRE